jgi:glutamate 5-kinase
MRGTLVIDDGCAAALARGGSLLPAGITAVDGEFARGDPVAVHDREGKAVAQGLVEYTSAEVEGIKGRRSDQLEALLGYAPRAAVIHRDQLVLL